MPHKKVSDWQRHVAPFLRKAIAQARRSFKPKNGMTPKKKKEIESLRKQKEKLNERIKRKLNGGR